MRGTAFRLLALVFVDEVDILCKGASGICTQIKVFDALLIPEHTAYVPVAVNIYRISFTSTGLLVVDHCTGLTIDSVVPVQCGKKSFLRILCFQSYRLIVSRLQIRIAPRDVERITVVGW